MRAGIHLLSVIWFVNQEFGSILQPQKHFPSIRFFLFRRPQFRREASKPSFAVLFAVSAPQVLCLLLAKPLRDVDERSRLEALSMERTLYFRRQSVLDRPADKWRLILRKTDAITGVI